MIIHEKFNELIKKTKFNMWYRSWNTSRVEFEKADEN